MPARLLKIVKAAKSFDISAEPGDGTSHWKLRRDGFPAYTIPAHNGKKTEISDRYINGLCRHFCIDRDQFKSRL